MPKIPLNLTSEGLKYPPEVRVRHETCSTICGTHVQAILDQKKLTGLAGGVKEGQDMAPEGPRKWRSINQGQGNAERRRMNDDVSKTKSPFVQENEK